MEPKFEPFTLTDEMKLHPSVVGINYDASALHIALSLNDERRVDLQNCFNKPVGFRVLNEGDLLEFWENHDHGSHWLYLVREGGWNDLESTRDGYLSSNQSDLNEYLVVGRKECVSVLSHDRPVIIDTAPNLALLRPAPRAVTAACS